MTVATVTDGDLVAELDDLGNWHSDTAWFAEILNSEAPRLSYSPADGFPAFYYQSEAKDLAKSRGWKIECPVLPEPKNDSGAIY